MTWQQLATIETSRNWIVTQPITGSLFRLTHNTQSNRLNELRAIIGQTFYNNGTPSYFNISRLTYKPEVEVFTFNYPKELIDRRIGIRRLDLLPDPWNISIEVFQPQEVVLTIEELIANIQTNLEEVKMTLANPITVNIPSNQEILSNVISNIIPVPTNIGIATVLVAANEGRRGLTLFNNSVGGVMIDFGKTPTYSDYAVLVAPQGYYELPYLYTGEIQGLWDNSGGIGVIVREFINYNPEPQA